MVRVRVRGEGVWIGLGLGLISIIIIWIEKIVINTFIQMYHDSIIIISILTLEVRGQGWSLHYDVIVPVSSF